MRKIYIVESALVQSGIMFNNEKKYFSSKKRALEEYEKKVQMMVESNLDMVNDKENYNTATSASKYHRSYHCYYKYQYGASNFFVEMNAANLEDE